MHCHQIYHATKYVAPALIPDALLCPKGLRKKGWVRSGCFSTFILFFYFYRSLLRYPRTFGSLGCKAKQGKG
jgi:hypothetical protein